MPRLGIRRAPNSFYHCDDDETTAESDGMQMVTRETGTSDLSQLVFIIVSMVFTITVT